MLKPKLLRQEISRLVPWVRENPDRLALYVPREVMSSGGVVPLRRLNTVTRWKCW